MTKSEQIKNLLKTYDQDCVVMSLLHYEQMRELVNQYELENAKLKRENSDLIVFIEQLGIPSGIKIIPSSISSKTIRDVSVFYYEDSDLRLTNLNPIYSLVNPLWLSSFLHT